MKKKLFIISLTLVLVIYIIVNHVLPYSPIKPYRIDITKQTEFKNGILPSDYGLTYIPLTINTYDSIKLKAYYIKCINPKATIILLHGIADCKEHFYSFCKKLNAINCNTVIIDSRAHGQSEGIYCTFGAKEKYDISQVVDTVFYTFHDSLIGIFGSSLGGAIALQTTAINNKIKFAIIESTFNNLENVINEYFCDLTGFKFRKLVHYILYKSGQIANFQPFNVNPEESCKSIQCPVLMSHGNADTKIPIEFGKINFQNLASKNKEFIEVEGAGHFNVHEIGGENYWKKLEKFILQQFVN